MKNYILTEKYRPIKFEDVIGIPEEIVNSVEGGNTSHLLLTGIQGTGKSTTGKIIANMLAPNDTLPLNASDERGIDVIREKVKIFAMTNSSSGGIKIVFLDEADYLTKDAQATLRVIMETYASTCKFILTGNYENKIIDALKSRCSWFKFGLPDKGDICNRLKFIASEESISIESEAIIEIVKRHSPDIRKCINILQELSFLNKTITKEMIIIDSTQVDCLFEQINGSIPWAKVRQWVLNNNLDYNQVIVKMVDHVETNRPNNWVDVLLIIMELNRYINVAANPEVEFSISLMRIMLKVRKKGEAGKKDE